jgi:hypothetical protein
VTDQPTQHDSQPFEPVTPEPAQPALANQRADAPPAAASAGVPVQAGRPGRMSWVNVALAVALAVAIGGIGFAAGRLTAPASLTAANGIGRFGNGTFPGGLGPNDGYFPAGGFQGGNDDGGFRGLFGAGGASIEGTVESISGDTLTLKLANGSTIQVSLSGTTTYHAQASAAAGDVQAGGTVIVRVQLNRGVGTGTATSPSATDVTIVP